MPTAVFRSTFLRPLIGAALSLAAVPAAAAAEPGSTLRDLQVYDQVLTNIGYRLQTAAGDLCPQVPVLGFAVQDLSQYGSRDREIARREFGYSGAPLVLAVAEDSPAARAGLQVDDGIAAIDGQALPTTFAADSDSYRRVSLVLDLLDRAAGRGVLVLTIVRNGTQQTVRITPATGCAARFQTRLSGGIDAVSDDTDVLVDVAAMRFAGAQDQIAAIVGHELSHVILKHHDRLAAIQVDRIAAIRATEDEADRLSVYLLDRAGYPTAAIVRFWQRYRRSHLFGPARDPTHGSVRERVAAIEAEIARIAQTKARGQSPRPSFLPPRAQAAR